jgi:hypothetical protein
MAGPDKRQHEDLYTELIQGANRKGSFVVETDDDRPDIEFSVNPADKPTRNKLRRLMPSGILDAVDLPDDIENIDPEDISMDDIDISEISIEDMTFSEEATNVWLDNIAEHFEHSYYSESEIRNIFEALDDPYFISAGSYLVELGAQAGPVKGFHKE